ncbi:hypothetical protein D3C71_745010 [compost metagenome]
MGHQGIRIIDGKFQMLGGDAVGERNGVGELFDQNDRAEIGPACRRRFGTRQALQLPLDGRFNGLAEFGIVGDQDRLRAAIMFRLRQKIGSQPVRIIVLVGNDKHFRRPGDHVDADSAENLALCGGHIGIAGADDLGDRRDGFRAIGKRCHGLCAANTIDFLDACDTRGGKHRRIDRAAIGRHDHDDTFHAGNLCRHGVHQHRAWVAGRAAGHIKAHGFDRRPARAEAHADIVLVDIVLRHLPRMVFFDTPGSKFKRLDHAPVDGGKGCIDLIRRDTHRDFREIDTVEFLGIMGKGGIAAMADIVDDVANGRVDVFGNFSLGCQESREFLFEISRCPLQPDCHAITLSLSPREIPRGVRTCHRKIAALVCGINRNGKERQPLRRLATFIRCRDDAVW